MVCNNILTHRESQIVPATWYSEELMMCYACVCVRARVCARVHVSVAPNLTSSLKLSLHLCNMAALLEQENSSR